MNSMNSQNVLINRMSTANVNKLLEFTQKYQASGQRCIDELCEVNSWLDLKYDTICVLNDVFGVGYSPTNVSTLFKKLK